VNFKPCPGALPTEQQYNEMLDQYMRETRERTGAPVCVEINGVRIYLPPNLGISIKQRGV